MQYPITKMHFSSGQEYYAWLKQSKPNRDWDAEGYGHNAADLNHAFNMLQNGNSNPSDLEAINALVEQFTYEIPTRTRTIRHSVKGHRVNVGAYLGGSPLNMYQRAEESTDRAPIRIWVGTTSSISISSQQITKRGAALAAFAMSLASHRTVYITPYSGQRTRGSNSRATLTSVDLSASPLYLNELAAHMNVHLARYLGMYGNHCLTDYADGGPVLGANAFGPSEVAYLREQLGAAPHDIVLGPIHAHDPALTNPIKWITDNLDKILNPTD